jgi:PAS domain S-box-containing protein
MRKAPGPIIRAALEKAFTEGIPYELDLVIITAKGNRKNVRTMGVATTDENHKVLRVHGTFQDITEYKKMEQSLRENEEMFRSIFKNSLLGAHMYELQDDTLIFIGSNSAADNILGVDNTQYLGKSISEAFPSLTGTDIIPRLTRIAKEGGVWRYDHILYKDEQIEGAFENFNFQISQNKMVSMFNDITERISAEQKTAGK